VGICRTLVSLSLLSLVPIVIVIGMCKVADCSFDFRFVSSWPYFPFLFVWAMLIQVLFFAYNQLYRSDRVKRALQKRLGIEVTRTKKSSSRTPLDNKLAGQPITLPKRAVGEQTKDRSSTEQRTSRTNSKATTRLTGSIPMTDHNGFDSRLRRDGLNTGAIVLSTGWYRVDDTQA